MRKFYVIFLSVVIALMPGALSVGNSIGTPPTITTSSLPDGAVWWHYSQTLSAKGTAPIKWSLVAGELPKGLDISEDGIISGTPQIRGRKSFVVKARNSAGYTLRRLSIFIDNEIITDILTGGNGCNASSVNVAALLFVAALLVKKSS